MFIAPSSRPRFTRVVKEQPHDVQVTIGNVTVTPLDTLTVTPGGEEGVQLPAFFVATAANGGSNSNPGTEASPFETLTKARDAMRSSSNPTVTRTYVRGGTHNVTSQVSLNSNDVSTEWLAYPTETPVFDQGGGAFRVFSLTSSGNNITIKGLTFQNSTGTTNTQNANGSESTIYATNCTNLVIEGNTFDDVWSPIAGKDGLNGLTILENDIFDCPGSSITIWGTQSDGVDIAGNRFRNVNMDLSESQGQLWQGWAIQVQRPLNCRAEYNDIDGCSYIGIRFDSVNEHPVGTSSMKFNVVKDTCRLDRDGSALYIIGREGQTTPPAPFVDTGIVVDSNWCQNSGGLVFDDPPLAGSENTSFNFGIYLDDVASGVTMQNNVIMNCSRGSFQIHGGGENDIINNIGLLRDGATPTSPKTTGITNERFARIRSAPPHSQSNGSDMGGNNVQRNIMVSVDDNLTRVAFATATEWMESTSESPPDFVNQDNVLWQNINFNTELANETSSVQQDPDFHTYDPTNKVLRLNKISRGDATDSPAFGEGFVDIAGITDGGTFVWGSPLANSNSAYDRDNY